jgi:predicted metalloprotease with PDZ domain
LIRVGEHATKNAYREDWVLVHELIHLAFPSVPREQHWAEEGLATYVEPFARVRAGLLKEEDAWAGLVDGLPNGLPGPRDRGLDRTPTWGRIYWGGALFWLLADVALRSENLTRVGLEHALRGVNAAGGTNAVRWPLVTVLAEADKAAHGDVLRKLYGQMANEPHPVDLGALFHRLGVTKSDAGVHLDDHAELAAVRRAIAHGTD